MELDAVDEESKKHKNKPPIEQPTGGKQNDGFILEDEIYANDKLQEELPVNIRKTTNVERNENRGICNGNKGKKPMVGGGNNEPKEELSGRLRSMKNGRINDNFPNGLWQMRIESQRTGNYVWDAKIPFGKIWWNEKGTWPSFSIPILLIFMPAPISNRLHNKFGIRHFVLIGLLALYSIFGGLMFEAIERENEIRNMEKTSRILDHSISMLAYKINDTLNVNATFEQNGQLKLLIKQYYLEMLKIEDKYIGSVFHKYETLDIKKVLSWYFGSSVFYAMTLFTTIGYGTIACQTPLGKIASIFYAIFGIPLTLVVLSDLGQLMFRFFTFIYERGSQICKNCLRLLAIHILKSMNHDEIGFPKSKGTNKLKLFHQCSESIEENYNQRMVAAEFPLSLAIIIVSTYFLFVSFLVSNFDWDETGGGRELSFGDAFYFAFFSVTTIGLGDVMPNNLQYSPILAIVFLFGLALLSVVNSTIYIRIHGFFLKLVDNLEDYLECVNHYQHDAHQQGYFIFKSLGPSIQLLALALPIFPDDQQDQIGVLEPENTNLGHRVFPTFSFPAYKLSRAHTMGTFDSFRPTLGILNAVPPSRKGIVFSGGSVESWRKREKDCPSGRRRAATISCLTIPSAGEMMAKTLRWEDQQRENRNFRKMQRMYTRRGERQFGCHTSSKININLRRVQSEPVPPTIPSSLSTIVESGGAKEGAERKRYIFENLSPRRIRRMMMRRGEGNRGLEIGRRTSGD